MQFGADAKNWASLERALLMQHGTARTCMKVMGRPQTLIGVAQNGIDPRGMRRVPVAELGRNVLETIALASAVDGTLHTAARLPSGPVGKGDPAKAPKDYIEFEVDLVECGEQLCPGSSEWAKDHLLWTLASPFLPPLDAIREELARLKWSLRMCTPSPQQRQALTDETELSPEAAASRYSASLDPLSQRVDVRVLSLLAGLIAESHMVDDETLLSIHKEHFLKAVDLLLEHKWMEDLRRPFERLVRNRFLLCSWESPALQHRGSIHAPYIALAEWERRTGISGWRGHDW